MQVKVTCGALKSECSLLSLLARLSSVSTRASRSGSSLLSGTTRLTSKSCRSRRPIGSTISSRSLWSLLSSKSLWTSLTPWTPLSNRTGTTCNNSGNCSFFISLFFIGLVLLFRFRFVSSILPASSRLCFHRRLSVCLLAELRKNYSISYHKIRRTGGTWVREEMISFSE